MQKNAKQELVETLEKLTIEELINKIKSGEASASHLAVARGILNDNKILLLMNGDAGGSSVGALAELLPFGPDLEGPVESHG